MLDTKDPELLKYVQDYRINLIEPAGIEPQELDKFSTSLREVLGYIKYANDKDKLVSFITANPDTVIDAMVGLVRDNLLSIRDAAARVNMTEEAFTAMLRK